MIYWAARHAFEVAGATLLGCWVAVSPCLASEVPLKEGQYLAQARPKLLRLGWKPVVTHYKLADGTLERAFGDAGSMLGAGYVEVERCAGTGRNPCVFNYRKRGVCLRVFTYGEYDPGPTEGPVVSTWRFQCPDESPENRSN